MRWRWPNFSFLLLSLFLLKCTALHCPVWVSVPPPVIPSNGDSCDCEAWGVMVMAGISKEESKLEVMQDNLRVWITPGHSIVSDPGPWWSHLSQWYTGAASFTPAGQVLQDFFISEHRSQHTIITASQAHYYLLFQLWRINNWLIARSESCLVYSPAGPDLALLSERGLTRDWLLLERRNLGLQSRTLSTLNTGHFTHIALPCPGLLWWLIVNLHQI